MSSSLKLSDISQDQFNVAELTTMGLIRAQYPSLDLRQGTTLRQLLIGPDAALAAFNNLQVSQIQSVMSLETMAASGTATAEEVNPILSNFNTQLQSGTVTQGTVVVRVTSSRIYTVGAGTQFTTLDGLAYQVSSDVTADPTPASGESKLYTATDGTFYFLLPVTAMASGTAYNLNQGTALTPSVQIYSMVTASAYTPFTGGTDSETVAEAIARIPAAVSIRGLLNKTSVSSQLHSAFDGSSISIAALSTQGFGDLAQIRDKHNLLGIAVGSRVDVYARTFTTPQAFVLRKTGTLVAPNTYSVTILPADAPAYYMVRSITDQDGISLAGYQYQETRSAQGLSNTTHDIVGLNEVNYTVWQAATILIKGVADTAQTHDFLLQLYGAPGITALQTYIDDPSVAPVGDDYIVRCPLMCLVSVHANVYYPATAPVDLVGLKALIAQYINSRSFVPILTRSELISIFLANGVSHVDLGVNGMKLSGVIRGADAKIYQLSGDSLDIASIQSAQALITPSTVVFAAEPIMITLTGTPE